MNAMKFSLMFGLLWCGLSAAIAVGDESANGREQREKFPVDEAAEAIVGPVHSANAWLGRAIISDDGHGSGRVEDFAFDIEDGWVAFVIVKPEDSRPDDPSRLGLPIELLSASRSAKTLSARTTSKLISKAPRLGLAAWTDTITELWAITTYEHFELESPWPKRLRASPLPEGKQGKAFLSPGGTESHRFIRMSELHHKPVADAQGRVIGRIEDFAIADLGNRIAYAATLLHEEPPGKSSGAAKRLCAIPLWAFLVKPRAPAWELDLPEGLLADAPTIAGDHWPEQIGRGWVAYARQRYGPAPLTGVRRDTKQTPSSAK